MDAAAVKSATEAVSGLCSQVEPILAISTSHVTKETAGTLTNRGVGPLIVYPHGEYGWLIFAAYPEGIDETVIPDELMAAVRFASSLGCAWLLLDRDACEIDDLPTWEW